MHRHIHLEVVCFYGMYETFYFGPVPKVVGDAFQPGSCPNSNRMEKEAAIP